MELILDDPKILLEFTVEILTASESPVLIEDVSPPRPQSPTSTPTQTPSEPWTREIQQI